MRSIHWKAAGIAAVLAVAATAAWAAAPQKGGRNTPASWSYEVRNGQRVPRIPRTVNPDGSWVEDYKNGNNCIVKREGRKGEVREVRKCD